MLHYPDETTPVFFRIASYYGSDEVWVFLMEILMLLYNWYMIFFWKKVSLLCATCWEVDYGGACGVSPMCCLWLWRHVLYVTGSQWWEWWGPGGHENPPPMLEWADILFSNMCVCIAIRSSRFCSPTILGSTGIGKLVIIPSTLIVWTILYKRWYIIPVKRKPI